jgi:hypothetical protein
VTAQEVACSPPPSCPSVDEGDEGDEGWLPCDSPPCDRLPPRDRRRRRLRPVPSAEWAAPSGDSTAADAADPPSGAGEEPVTPAEAPARTSWPLRVRRRARVLRSRGAPSSS